MNIASPLIALPLAALLGLAACAAPRVGVDDLDVLSAQAPDEVIASGRPVEALAACFQERADFLPLSRFVMTETHWRYSLAGYGSAYESVTIRPTATGSEAEIRLGAYDARWTRNFEDGRGQALRACAASDTNG
ncbi:hypothetical protein [Brevundimonas aurifodinae]|uniref:Lipoprotein n=2 Tax=Brevundimonas TaxID=41275 RepID=A0ABV1NME4_9CAUL|nr:MAG: hypothetical protein B7Z42_15055 [Brevundimonas sp. 12-68-7]OYX31804.1 MAG: hypothetical protein B7Z01_12180 [Brevundimonas subvibrioides]